jgi:hypothetical protein
MKTLAIDIETENTGSDIMKDNKRIISVQIGSSTKQELYYADSPDLNYSLSHAKSRISSLIDEGTVFAGYNVKGFDVPLLKKFLDIEIPDNNLIELSETDKVTKLCQLQGKRLKLEEVCSRLKIDVSHKQEMNLKAEEYRTRPDIINQAKVASRDLSDNTGWGLDFCYKRVLDKIAVGNAIFDSYQKFVEHNGAPDSLFYRYAVGDIISEYHLFQAVTALK